MFIDKQSPIPIYYQIKSYIMENITSGKWNKENPIPSERELGQMAKVSRMTVRQAVNELVNEGVLYRLKGKGTFIIKSKIEQRDIMSFSEMVKNKGLKPITEVLIFKNGINLPSVCGKLGLPPEQKLYRIKRLRKAGSIPVGVEDVYIPEHYCPGLKSEHMAGSMYKLLLEEYQYKISKCDLNIEAIPANEKEHFDLLEADNSIPLLKVSGTSTTHTGLLLFYETSYYRSEQLSYKVSIFSRQDF